MEEKFNSLHYQNSSWTKDCFKVAVLIDGSEMATAEDFNKKSAEQSAALKVLSTLDMHAYSN